MKRIELQLDEEILERARQLAASRHCTVEELIADLLKQAGPAEPTNDLYLGLLADEPELMDQVMESVMKAREEHLLRATGG